MKINIYGDKSFKKEMNQLMINSNLSEVTESIDNIEDLEYMIESNPNDIYLIDSSKIISKNIITDKLNFLKPKDAIYKHILENHGIDDMCFNSNEALISYIIDKIDSQDTIDKNDKEVVEKIIQERNMNDITQIDEIIENDLLDALDEESIINNTLDSSTTKDISTTQDIILSNNDEINTEKIELSNTNFEDVSSLLKHLLNNKTLELSIKIKDS